MAIIHFADTLKAAVLVPVATAIDAGTHSGIIRIFSGTMPANTTIAPTAGTQLGTLLFSDPCTATPGSLGTTLTAGAITQDSSADRSGIASWARVSSRTGVDPDTASLVTVCDVDITTTGGGGTMQMNTTNIVIGGPILINSFVLSVA